MAKSNLTKTSRMLISFKKKLEERRELLRTEIKLEIENNYPDSMTNALKKELNQINGFISTINYSQTK
jgi:hypothetical protein